MKNKIRVLFCIVIILISIFLMSACNKKTSQNIEITPYGTELEIINVDEAFLEDVIKVLKDCEREYLNIGTDAEVVVDEDYFNDFNNGKFRDYSDSGELNRKEYQILIYTKGLVESTYKMRSEDYNTGKTDWIEIYDFYRESLYEYMEKDKRFNENHPIRIHDVSWYTDSNNRKVYKGTVKNHGSRTYSDVQIKVIYEDENKEALTYETQYVVRTEGIKPNESKQFTVISNVRGDVKYARSEVVRYR